VLCAKSVDEGIAKMMAFLIHNRLMGAYPIIFMFDGAKPLRRGIYERLGIEAPMILDWHHLKKKCSEKPVMAMRGNELRRLALKMIMPLLWGGAAGRLAPGWWILSLKAPEPEMPC
jgi:hypothetical protein